MLGTELLRAYLAELRAQLPPGLGWGARTRILREIEEHILTAAEDARAEGQPEALAVQQALARCGPPEAIATSFQVIANLHRVRFTRAGLLVSFALCIGLVGLTFLRYPAIVGSGRLTIFYLLVCVAILGGYAWVGLPTTQTATPEGILSLRAGTTMGLLAGVVGIGVGIAASLALMALWSTSSPVSAATTLWIDHRIEEAELALPFLIWSGGTLVRSFNAAARTGRALTGLQIGLWSSIVYALFSLLTGLAFTNLLANTLAQAVWAHDVACRTTHDIATCALGDDLGGATNALLGLPLLGISIGWLGGKLGSRERQAPSVSDQPPDDVPGYRHTIPLFAAWSCALFLLGVLGHVW